MSFKRKFSRRLFFINEQKLFAALFLLSLASYGFSQISSNNSSLPTLRRETGIPYFRNYTPKEYGGSAQSWAIAQDRRGLMYFGNNLGVLEYDGVSWRTILVSNGTVVRALACAEDGTMYVGAQREFGYLKPDSLGRLQYASLLNEVPEAEREFADVLRVHAAREGVYFQTQERLFLRSPSGLRVWKPASAFHFSFLVRERLYIREVGLGLMAMNGDSLQLAPDGARFAETRIYAMLPFAEGKILIGTREQGLFLYDGAKATPFLTEADGFLLEHQLYHAAALAHGFFALATLRGGVALIDHEGRMVQTLDKSVGLRDNNVWYVAADAQQGLWLALNNGIARAELPAPLSQFDERNGLRGNVETVLRHRGRLYAATHQGVFYLQPAMPEAKRAAFAPAEFLPVDGIANQSWALLSTGEALLVAAFGGVYQIHGARANMLRPSFGHSYSLHRSRQDTTLIYVGLENGLAMLRYEAASQGWRDAGMINGIEADVRSIAETEAGDLWLGTRTRALMRVTFSRGFTPNPSIATFSAQQGLPAAHGWITPILFDRRELFVTERGLFRLEEATQRFVPDTTFGTLYADTLRSTGEGAVDGEGNFWLQWGGSAAQQAGVAVRLNHGAFVWRHAPFARLADFVVYDFYREARTASETGETVWFSGPDGLVRYERATAKNYDASFGTALRQVTKISNEAVIFGGVDSMSAEVPELEYADNALRFEFAATSYEAGASNQFQYFLEGFDKDWSAWTRETKKDYTNLAENLYRFRVRAKNLYEHESAETVWEFRVLPPWYRKWWAYLFYLGALGFVIVSGVKYRTRQLEHRSRRLEATVQERTAELNATLEHLQATQQQLIVQEKLASLGALTAGIAHEIKNPLNFVNNFAVLSVDLVRELREELEKAKEAEGGVKMAAEEVANLEELFDMLVQNAEKINHHGKRADSIVKSMMEHSRGSMGERERVDINRVLEEAVNLTYHGLRAQNMDFNITIEKDYDSALGEAEVVTQDLSRVFINILNNACYAAYEKQAKAGSGFLPTLNVSTKARDHKIEIRIRDNGTGIPAHVRDQIFNPFFTTKPTGKGTGLGLSISYDIIVQQHKGTIEVFSEEGEFTEFVITLPKS